MQRIFTVLYFDTVQSGKGYRLLYYIKDPVFTIDQKLEET